MNFEDNIKDKLESRRIEPTASAWDRIEGKLEVAQGKKKSKVVLWTGIAASFIAGVFITMLLFNSNSQDIERDFVVTPDTKKIIKEIEAPIYDPVIKKESEVVTLDIEKAELIAAEEVEEKEKPEIIKPLTINKKTIKKTSGVSVFKDTQVAIATRSKTTTTTINDNTSENILLEKTIKTSIDNKIDEVVASIDPETVTDQEVEELLSKAHKEIIGSRVFDATTNKVNANALLLDAEAEVDPDTFKEKIFKTLKTGFDKALEAVVTRDN